MADPSAVIPFWETLAASVLASGLLSAMMTAGYERRKQNKRLQIDRLEKAIRLLRTHYEETTLASANFLAPPEMRAKLPRETVAAIDVNVAVLTCAPWLEDEYKKYNKAQVVAHTPLAAKKGKTPKTQDALDTTVMDASLRLKEQHDVMITSMLSRIHLLMGVSRKLAWRQFRQAYSDYSARFWRGSWREDDKGNPT